MPREVKENVERLHDEALQNPQKAIPELLALIKKYPKISLLYNYLTVAYNQSGQRKKAKSTILEAYRRYPNYLFARINYATLCLSEGNPEKVAKIFEHKYDLKALYPNRKRFHITEVAGFMGVIGLYFLAIGERETAEKYDEILQEIAPDLQFPRELHRRLHPTLLQRFLRWLFGRR